MASEERTWELLQSRWASGEILSDAEEAERLRLAAQELDRMREVDVSKQLKQFLATPEVIEPEFVEAVVGRVNGRRAPHLRLVAQGDQGTREAEENRADQRRLRWWHGVVAISAAAAVGLLFVHSKGDEAVSVEKPPLAPMEDAKQPTLARSELVFVSGDVTLDGKEVRLGQSTLNGGEELATGAGRACFTVEPSINVCVAEESRVVVSSLVEEQIRIKVVEGRAVAALGPRKEGHTFTLSDGEVNALARGTIFALTKDAARTRVTVVEGRVEVSHAKRGTALVKAHSQLDVRPGVPDESSAISRAQEAQFLALVAPRDLWQRGELGLLSVGREADGSEAMIGDEGPFPLPVTTFAPVGRHRIVIRDAVGAEALLDVEVRPGETREVDSRSATPRRHDAAETVRSKKSASELLGEARAAITRGDSRAALAAYRRLRALYPNSAEASTVLVTMGKLELRQNSPAGALNAFNAYLGRGGPLEPEALAGKIRALRALGRKHEEQRVIESYLRRYPNGFEAVALKKRLEILSVE